MIFPLVHIPSTVVLKTITLMLGALIAFLSFRAYRRTGAIPLAYLALGFGFVTLGSIAGGIIDVGLDRPRRLALLVESGLTAVGFGVIVYSLYTR